MWKGYPLRNLTLAVLKIKDQRNIKKENNMGSVRVRPNDNAYRLEKN